MPQEFVPDLETFQAAVGNSYDIVDLLHEDGTILYVSLSVSRVLGFAPEGLVGKNGFDFVHPDDLPRLQDELAAAQLHGKGELSVCLCKNAAGNWRKNE